MGFDAATAYKQERDNMLLSPITMENPLWSLFMALEHDRIHLETSSVLIRELPTQRLMDTQSGDPILNLGLPVVPFYPEGSPTRIDYRRMGTLILTSLLEEERV